MATKKDLVEAYSFSRRRLVTAFVSGAPGGREVEPARPGRSIVGGLALGVLLIAGAAIAGVFTSSVDPAWAEKPGLVISKEEAEVFVITEASTEPVLHPILNITSAKLILGSDVEPQVIPEEYIAQEQIGSDLGIFGAPYDVPDTSRLIQSGWTACTDGASGGLRLHVTEDELVAPSPADGGMLVTVGRETWLVALSRPDAEGRIGAYRYLVPNAGSSSQDLVVAGVGLAQGEPVAVSREWLNLFPEGDEISRDTFGVQPQASDPDAEGALLLINDAPYLRLAGGELAPLDPFALAVAGGLADGRAPLPFAGDIDDVDLDPSALAGIRWPATTLQPVFGQRCARLVAEPGQPPLVELVQDPQGEAAAPGGRGESATVAAGAGAFVLRGGWDQAEGGSPVVVDSKGYAYPLVDAVAPARLGYDGFDAPVVPDSWMELFESGVELSENAALCAPRVTGDTPCT